MSGVRFRFVLPGLLVLACSLLVLSVACGGDDDDGDDGDGPSSSSGQKLQEVNVIARDFSFEAPDSIAGGLVRFKLKNEGKDPHQAQMVRLNDGVTLQQFQTAAQSPDPSAVLRLITVQGGPNGVSGGKSQDVVNNLQAGSYLYLCFVSGEDGVSHIEKGMVKPFQVTAPTGTAEPPTASAQVTLADFSFLGADSFSSGKTTVEVTNGGPQPHELTVYKLSAGVTVDDLRAMLASEDETPPSGPSPVVEAGGLGAIMAGQKGYVDLDLTSGNYVFVCFLPDPNSGAPHAALGMVKGVTVR